MSTWLPASTWTRKGPRSVSDRIRQRELKKVKPARKSETVIQKLQISTSRISKDKAHCGKNRKPPRTSP